MWSAFFGVFFLPAIALGMIWLRGVARLRVLLANGRLTLGVGLGYLEAQGSVYLSEGSDQPACAAAQTAEEIQTQCPIKRFDQSGGALATSLHWGYRGRGWWFRAGNRTPWLRQDGATLSAQAATLELSWEW